MLIAAGLGLARRAAAVLDRINRSAPASDIAWSDYAGVRRIVDT